MAAAPIPEPDRASSPYNTTNPDEASPPNSSAKNDGSINSIYELLYRLVLGSPSWVRGVAVLVLVAAIGIAVAMRFLPGPPVPPSHPQSPVAITPGSYLLSNGSQVDASGNANHAPQNVDATDHAKEDAEHATWHADHPEVPEPTLNVITQTDEKNFVKFKFYSKTDGCVFVLRQVDGVPTSQWVRNPHFKEVGAALRDAEPGKKSQEGSDTSVFAGLLDALVPPAAAATQLSSPHTGLQSQNVQAQARCLNPHPGQFKWWWGPPEDQCWSPMYREWRDGCKHYQRFNKCANAWDDRIFWVNCSGPPHS